MNHKTIKKWKIRKNLHLIQKHTKMYFGKHPKSFKMANKHEKSKISSHRIVFPFERISFTQQIHSFSSKQIIFALLLKKSIPLFT